jgi:hypothetical protein
MRTSNQWLFEAPFLTQVKYYSNPYVTAKLESEWLFEAPPTSLSTPSLISSESTPPSSTLYVNIDIGCTKKGPKVAAVCPIPMTGIFIPEKYRVTESVDLILYLQGHHTDSITKSKILSCRYPTNLTINQYWNQTVHPYFAFREGVNDSGKNVILVAPTLGPRSEAGKIIQAAGFDAYLDQVMAALNFNGPHRGMAQRPKVGQIILACHSGGGLPMQKIALSQSKYANQIRECWGFDCLYNTGDEETWRDWAKQRPNAKLYIHYGNGKTDKRSENLKRLAHNLPNIAVEGLLCLGHNFVPIMHWRNRILAAPFLNSK